MVDGPWSMVGMRLRTMSLTYVPAMSVYMKVMLVCHPLLAMARLCATTNINITSVGTHRTQVEVLKTE